jgi:hypothetical protein
MPSQLSGLEKRHVHVRGRAVRVEQNNRDGKRREHGKSDHDDFHSAAHAVILAADSAQRKRATAATAIHVAVYNFCRIHSTIRSTPAMAAGCH